MTIEFSGHDELSAAFNAGSLAAVNMIVLGLAIAGTTGAWALWAVGLALTPVTYFAARYRLRVGPHRVELTRYHVWPLWRETTTYGLDVEVAPYDSWDSDRDEGLFVRSRAIGDPDSEPFGPYWSVDEMLRVRTAMNDAIASQRRAIDSICPRASLASDGHPCKSPRHFR